MDEKEEEGRKNSIRWNGTRQDKRVVTRKWKRILQIKIWIVFMLKQEMWEVWNEAEFRKSILLFLSELERFTAQYQFPVQLRSNIALHLKVSYLECSGGSPLLSIAYGEIVMQTKPLQGLIWFSLIVYTSQVLISHTSEVWKHIFPWRMRGKRQKDGSSLHKEVSGKAETRM